MAYSDTLPFILYDNSLDDATLTATSTATGYAVNNLKDRLTWTKWRSTGSATERIVIDYGAGNSQIVNTVAISGHNIGGTSNTSGRITLEGSTDNITYAGGESNTDLTPFNGDTLTFSARGAVLNTTAYRYHRVTFTLLDSGSADYAEVGAMCVGRRLDFEEWMSMGFDLYDRRLQYQSNVARDGTFTGGVVGHVSQSARLRFSRAGVARTWMETTGLPSWDDFLRRGWSNGLPFWFNYCGENDEGPHFYCWPSKRSRHRAPFISGTRQRMTLDFDVLAERHQQT